MKISYNLYNKQETLKKINRKSFFFSTIKVIKMFNEHCSSLQYLHKTI